MAVPEKILSETERRLLDKLRARGTLDWQEVISELGLDQIDGWNQAEDTRLRNSISRLQHSGHGVSVEFGVRMSIK